MQEATLLALPDNRKTKTITNMKRISTALLLLLCLTLSVAAQSFDKKAYYAKAHGLKGQALKTALAGIIASHTTISYDGLYEAYKETDLRPDGKIWDMYSNVTNFDPDRDRAGSYKKEGDCFNREHSVPQSIFNEASPMKTDLYNVFPTDGYVNNRRSNYSLGEVGTVKFQSAGGFSKQGSPSAHMHDLGCSETSVFEPNDIYKGDLARSCFYFVTCYESRMKGFKSFGMFQTNTYPSLTDWARDMLLEWSEMDQVAQKETDRIEAAYRLQKNRNPFIDFPGLEQYIWGSYRNVPLDIDNYVNPYKAGKPDGGEDNGGDNGGGDNGGGDNGGDNGGGNGGNGNGNGEGDNGGNGGNGGETDGTPLYYERVTSTPASWTGEYLIVYEGENGALALDASLKTYDAQGNGTSVSITDDRIALATRTDAAVFTVRETAKKGEYSIQGTSGLYIGTISSSNSLESSKDPIANSFEMNASNVDIASNLGSSRNFMRYNTTASRFRYYKSGQQPVSLFRKVYKKNPTGIAPITGHTTDNAYYDLQGRRQQGTLRPGLYIHGGRKVIVR